LNDLFCFSAHGLGSRKKGRLIGQDLDGSGSQSHLERRKMFGGGSASQVDAAKPGI